MRPYPERQINVGLLGMGNIGTGVARWFQESKGDPFGVSLKRAAIRDLSKPRAFEFSALTDKPQDILNDPSIDIVVELMGGTGLAKQYTLDAIDRGKSVVDGNKALLAQHMKEIFDAARLRQVNFSFEASVGGGIPIIRTLLGYRGERITKIMGILNGTTNYMLTKMAEEGLDFETALKGAQEKGYAEAEHSLDTKGYDARDKLAVLTSLACNTQIDINQISCQGITDIKPVDMSFAGEQNHRIKLLAMASINNYVVKLEVTPALIRKDHPLAAASDSFNIIYIEGELAGPQTFYGRGAGEKPTSSAVISDILHVAANIRHGIYDELPTLDSVVAYSGGAPRKGFIRANLLHQPGSGAEALGILATYGLNVEDSVQRMAYAERMGKDLFVPDIITHEAAPQQNIDAALRDLNNSKRVHGLPIFLPIID